MGRGKGSYGGRAASSGATGTAVAIGELVAYAGLTAAERSSINEYSGVAFKPVNAHLREIHTNLAYLTKGEITAHIHNIDSAFGKSALTRDTTLYRGTSLQAFGLTAAPKRGATISDKAFQSTSQNQAYSHGFGDNVKLTIRAKAGTKALDVSRVAGGKEQEILLKRGTKYKVRNVKVSGGTTHLTVDVVD